MSKSTLKNQRHIVIHVLLAIRFGDTPREPQRATINRHTKENLEILDARRVTEGGLVMKMDAIRFIVGLNISPGIS